MINEYNQHKSGISYIQQGYSVYGMPFAIPFWKIEEHNVVSDLWNGYESDKSKRGLKAAQKRSKNARRG